MCYLGIGGNISQWNRTGGGAENVDARVALVKLGDLSLGVVFVSRATGNGYGMAIGVGASGNGRSLSEGQEGSSQGNKSCDFHDGFRW